MRVSAPHAGRLHAASEVCETLVKLSEPLACYMGMDDERRL